MDHKALLSLKSVTLLYVEDDAATREELALILEPWAGALYVASNGQEGLELFDAKRPDIVVTDIQMPKVNGLAMSERIRALVPEQPIVLISAYNDVEFLFKAIELGVDHYITKPVNVSLLLRKLSGMASTIRAFKERARNQALLDQYRTLVDQSAIVCKFLPDGKISYVNDKLCEISGYSASDLIGRDVTDLNHSREPTEDVRNMLATIHSGQRWSDMVRRKKKDGSLYVVESNVVPILDERGDVTEVVMLDVDVTAHYEVYESLVQSLSDRNHSYETQRHFFSEYKRALELGSSVCVLDRQYRVVSANRHFEALIGYTAAQLKGQDIGKFMPEASALRCLDQVAQADREQYISRTVRFVGSNGMELQFSVGFVGLRDLEGRVDSVILICQDITESTRLAREITATQRELLYMLGEVVESRSQETGLHIKRVAQVSKYLAQKVGLSDELADLIEMAAPMHDVGKVGITDAILHKPGRLDPFEFEAMKKHATIGFNILGKVDRPLIGIAASIAHEHHERFDGTGYPQGLMGEAIAIEARIVGIADVLDALSNERAYKPAWPEHRIIDYFRAERGRQFDPQLVDLLLSNWDEIKALRMHTSTN